MEDRYKVRTGLNLVDIVAKYSRIASPCTNWGPLLSKATMGLAALSAFSPLANSAMAQSGSSVDRTPVQVSSDLSGGALASKAADIDAPWIWSPRLDVTTASNQGEVYFRKKFTLLKPQKAELTLAAGDEFELYINGEMIASGQSFGIATTLDPIPFLESGTNVVAIRVKHLDSNHVGLAMKMRIKEAGEVRYRVLRTDSTWRSYTAKAFEWYKNSFNAKSWLTSKAIQTNVSGNQVAVFGGAAKRNLVGGTLAVEAGQSAFAATKKARVTLSPTNKVKADPEMKASMAAFAKAKNTPVIKEAAKDVSSFSPSGSQTKVAKAIPRVQVSDVDRKAIDSGKVTPPVSATVGGVDYAAPPALPTIVPVTEITPKATPKVAPRRTVAMDAKRSLEITGSSDFNVSTVLSGKQTGSVIALEFNEYGQLLMSREGGPLMIADLVAQSGSQGKTKQVRVFCNEVSSCQGILPLNGDVFVTGDGPDGQALYRLSDKDGDGQAEVADTLLKFTGQLSKHGAHGVTLGPDGMLYVVVGNESRLKNNVSRRSPYQFTYEGDLQPKEGSAYPGDNISAPGGTVVRVGVDGSRPETVAGGIRNAYDLVFDQKGELFIHDSSDESERGTSWHRAPAIFNVVAGGELGWRSGWSKFAKYYLDQSSAVCETTPGTPTGAVSYQHLTFPTKYQNALFFADWSAGKIMSLKTKVSGAGYVGQPATFLSGKNLKVSDLAVGPDGAIYFSNGGTGKSSGIFKVNWNGQVPPEVMTFENDLAKVMRHPQPNSAWARQNIAELRRQIGKEWKPSVLGVITEDRNPPEVRVRGMQLSILYGPQLPNRILKTLTQDESPAVRSQAARMCGMSQRTVDNQLLYGLLRDSSSMVRRKTCEALLQADLNLKPTQLTHLLKSADRVEAATARRLLERIDASQWQTEMVNSQDVRLYLNSSLALMTAQPNLERAYSVLAEGSKALDGFLSDEDFLDLLRLVQVTLSQGKVEPAKIPAFVKRIGEEFPAGSPEINMELVKVLSGLEAGDLDGRLATWLQAPTTSSAEKFHAVTYFQRSANALSNSTRLAMTQAMAELKGTSESSGFQQNLSRAAKELTIDPRQSSLNDIIAGGDQWPEVVVESFYKMPNPLTDELAASLRTLDQKLIGREDQAAKKVRLGIIALLAQHGSEASFAWLRESFDNEPDRRADLAIGLAVQPNTDNWSYLVSSLPVVDDVTGKEIMEKLMTVRRRPKDPVHYRDAIELGYRLQGQSDAAANLLSHWTGAEVSNDSQTWQQQMNAWTQWYSAEFPSAAPMTTGGFEGVSRVAEREAIINASSNTGDTFIR